MITRRLFLAGGSAAALFASIASIAPSAARSGDEGLYRDVFDPDSSFIRILAPGQSFAAVDGKTIRDFTSGLSGYVNVMPGPITVSFSASSIDFVVAPSSHYTVVVPAQGEPLVTQDMLEMSPAKCDVTVFNLTPQPALSLYVPLAKAVAIDNLEPVESRSVALKAPLTLDLELRDGSQALATIAAVELKRKTGVTIVLTELDGTYSAAAVPNFYIR
ncbi:alginate O-acetyltransferase AlgF [Yangia mangrovi]|uniref:Alginate biosynthesis protein AlgF n=1 Tax=Alloyangia mangrovi TaxID=1779329 RepID=A0A2A3JTF7_9RHOB|nr:alginate O-acetyltransferase AlgF [Alloyangia mangrovi]MCT4372643.1 alginate O-acetyltransferase AlgF [Alloyangia mangrovi]